MVEGRSGLSRRRILERTRWLLAFLLAACATPASPPPPPPPPPQPPAPRPSAAGDRASTSLRPFPWPAPVPSDFKDIAASTFAGANNLAQVNGALVKALGTAGYGGRWSYYSVPNGFALVARIEYLKDDAEPQQTRFGFDRGERSLVSSIVGFFFPKPGYYRQIAFIVSNRSWQPRPGGPAAPVLTGPDAEKLLNDGDDSLPSRFAMMPFAPDYTVTALIYEFLAIDAKATPALKPANRKFDIATHFLRARLVGLLP
jgi:hypothetical protein